MRKWRNSVTGEVKEAEVRPGPGWELVSATSEDKGPVVRNFADGSTRVLKSGKTGDSESDWVVIAEKPQAQRKPPSVDYDPDGKAFYWDTLNGFPFQHFVPSLDDPRKASGYRAPSAPQYPTGGIAGNQTYIRDPYTGVISFGGPVPGTLSEEQQRQNSLADLIAQQRFTSGEAETQRGFTAGQSALDRALTAGQFASTLAAQQQRDRFAAEQDYQNRLRAFAQDKLSAAQAFASQVGATDPAALEAFYAAGGGNISNALAGGASAVSDNAVLPAAHSLRATREMVAPTRFTGFDTPISFQSPVQKPPEIRPGYPGGAFQPNGTFTYNGPNGPAAIGPAAGGFAPAPVSPSPQPEFEDVGGGSVGLGAGGISPLTRPGTPDWLNTFQEEPRYAFGTMGEPAKGTFITGDSAHPTDPFAGGAKPEKVTVKDPPGPNNAEAEVEPMSPPSMGGGMPLAQLFHSIAAMLDGGMERMNMGGMLGMDEPRYAFGTGYESITPTPEDDPYMREVRNIRQNVQFPQLNPYDVKFGFNPASLRSRYFSGMQTKFGVPVEDQQEQQQRYALRGTSRGAFNLGT